MALDLATLPVATRRAIRRILKIRQPTKGDKPTSWREVSDKTKGVPHGVLYDLAMRGREPRKTEYRIKLGLSVPAARRRKPTFEENCEQYDAWIKEIGPAIKARLAQIDQAIQEREVARQSGAARG